MVAIARLLQKKKKSHRVAVVVVTWMDIFRLLRVLLRTIMADKGTYRDVALPAAAAAAAAVEVEVAIPYSLFLSSSPSRHNSYFRYRFR